LFNIKATPSHFKSAAKLISKYFAADNPLIIAYLVYDEEEDETSVKAVITNEDENEDFPNIEALERFIEQLNDMKDGFADLPNQN